MNKAIKIVVSLSLMSIIFSTMSLVLLYSSPVENEIQPILAIPASKLWVIHTFQYDEGADNFITTVSFDKMYAANTFQELILVINSSNPNMHITKYYWNQTAFQYYMTFEVDNLTQLGAFKGDIITLKFPITDGKNTLAIIEYTHELS